MKVHRNDTVVVVKGKDKGKQGRVLTVDLKRRRILVEGINLIKKHVRNSPTVRQAGIVQQPSPLPVASVKVWCEKCGSPTRVGFDVREITDGDSARRQKVRICKTCSQPIE